MFSRNQQARFGKCLKDEHWLLRLRYSADIFHHMNQLNKSLQGPCKSVLTSSDKILAFRRKVNLWNNHVTEGNQEMLPLVLERIREEGHNKTSSLIEFHLGELHIKI